MTHYFLGNRLLATDPRQPWWSDTQQETHNLLYVCPTCGEVWGRVIVASEAEWAPIRAGCLLHPWTEIGIGGSFIHPWLHTLSHFPPELLVHEFNLRYERIFHAKLL